VYLDGNPPEIVEVGGPGAETKKVLERRSLSGKDSVAALCGEEDGVCGLEIAGFSAEESMDYPAWIEERMEAEYRLIRTGVKKAMAGEWKAVPYGAKLPPPESAFWLARSGNSLPITSPTSNTVSPCPITALCSTG
jgi:hypothetical protein